MAYSRYTFQGGWPVLSPSASAAGTLSGVYECLFSQALRLSGRQLRGSKVSRCTYLVTVLYKIQLNHVFIYVFSYFYIYFK